MEIRALQTRDAARCAELEQILFPGDNPWSRDIFAIEFSHPHTFYLGVFDDEGDEEVLVAYAGMAMLGPRDDPEFEIHTIAVDPEHQRRGLGRLLMDQLMHAADSFDGQVFLEVRTDNAPAIAMYEAFGFVNQGVRRNYYQPSGADAYTMSRPSRSEREQ
ncbi:ribosomal protein S18-alanine N-acetyltransferase [Corynebacterium halotolerans]|uniref:GNAT family acetyltransferase n=1 Tax=Corynebacterium halotolerans YIM 70093 = DSM 44683 TaxID=1121362 RepID=M1NVT0_9CORY|nr:ribosomal protein S18-alanine N-acetyltransferase [Corynebacterium halotolerans]AGF71600.1 GNAT family acetyltransferase [Corynebacterium halotolerans YIM 70093 = DSM 44683]